MKEEDIYIHDNSMTHEMYDFKHFISIAPFDLGINIYVCNILKNRRRFKGHKCRLYPLSYKMFIIIRKTDVGKMYVLHTTLGESVIETWIKLIKPRKIHLNVSLCYIYHFTHNISNIIPKLNLLVLL